MAEQTGSTVIIEAAPGEVMDVIADVTSYPQWVTGITHADILDPGAGRPRQVRLQVGAGAAGDIQVHDYEWSGDHKVTWTLHDSRSRTLRSVHGAYVLTPIPGGGTEVTHNLRLDLNTPMVGVLRRRAEKVITRRTLTGLKRRVDHLHRRTPR